MYKGIITMRDDGTVVVIGAGPYGLSVATYLKAQGVLPLVFGKPMELWHNMPTGLHLKSIWEASSLPDPEGVYTLDHYIENKNIARQEPIPLSLFLDYAHWYQKHTVPNIDPTYVKLLTTDGKRFHLELTDGRMVKANKVVVAVGIASFAYVPDFARDLPAKVASHTSVHRDLSRFQGQRVVVVGHGQSALEYAALLHEVGANVELIARGLVRWHSKILYDYTGPARHIFYPPGDVGPPGINWLVAFPILYSYLPDNIKHPVHTRAVRPGGAKWLRPRVEGHVLLTEQTSIVRAVAEEQGVRLELSDRTVREIDYLFLGTGFRPNFRKLSFIDTALAQQLQEHNGYPLLNSRFESSVHHLYFVGALAGHTFGPTCRFVSGAKVVARSIANHATQSV
jgi:thioredoxin reductase